MAASVSVSTSQRHIDLELKYGANNYLPLPVVIERAEGPWVWDPDGKKYLDMLSAYSALNQGHRHPRIIDALKNQADQVTLVSRAFHSTQMGRLLELLTTLTGYPKTLLMNTGAEAVETALKTVRKWGYKVKGVPADQAEIIVCRNNFHGRTTTIVGFSSEEQYRDGFGPFAPGFKLIDYGDSEALEHAITPHTVAFLVEPIQGEGGIIVPSAGYLQRVREICTRHNVLLALDEIQTGLGRTGKLFAFEHEDIRPDVLIVGKALGGGVLPISGVLSSEEIMGVFKPGDHGSTFGGNPLACAVARASLAVLVEEKLPERAARLGKFMMKELRAIESKHVADVRGVGLLIGVEIKVSSGPARPFCERLRDLGILAKETHGQVIRFAPPLVVRKRELKWALEQIAAVLQD
ncbi:MAG: ornithine--oxo-acid transaminase [Candidatus Schekmanbacteria bacterium]|nr:ornithine--oxo-acid transaminase [Candidatus Schekmanbacteria bacterium]